MGAPFEFATASRIRFGRGVAAEIPALVAACGRHALLVSRAGPELPARIGDALRRGGLVVDHWAVHDEPTVGAVIEATDRARQAGADVVVGLGGGSAIDAGKAVAALLTNPGDPRDYLEVVGRGDPLRERPAPFVAVPTTAGTGAEVTRNAVLLAEAEQVKVSLRSPLMLPAVAIVDPELGVGVPASVTASTGLDALTQLVEPFVSHRANPLTDAICRAALARLVPALRAAVRDGRDLDAREDMAFAALSGGLALANAALGAVHGFAGPLGGRLRAPHGTLCASLLPHVMRANIEALARRAPADRALARYDELGTLLAGRPSARAADAVALVSSLCAELGVPRLGALGLEPADIGTMVPLAARASSTKGNPIVLEPHELEAILRDAL